jgi:multimeric flavodoxin WrbA
MMVGYHGETHVFIILDDDLGAITMSKIVAVISSPRKGANGETLVNAMAEAARENGNEVEIFNVAAMTNRKGCVSCFGCKKAGKCIQKDDLTPVLDAIREADGVILSTAVYFGQPTAQYRLLEDRFFSFVGPDFVPNVAPKKMAVIVSAGSQGAQEVADQIAGRMAGFLKFECLGTIANISGNAPDAAANNADELALAAEIGKKF